MENENNDGDPSKKTDEDTQGEGRTIDLSGTIDYSSIPPTLVATNVPTSVYVDGSDQKLWFESQFKKIGGPVTFHYFKSFHRVRISYETSEASLAAKLAFDKSEIFGQEIGVYFIKVKIGSNSNLEPPEPDRMFLLSPPASPPVGWAPAKEAVPVVNYDLLQALTTLAPGETHELHPADGGKPQILVHTCETVKQGPKLKMTQTKRPEN